LLPGAEFYRAGYLEGLVNKKGRGEPEVVVGVLTDTNDEFLLMPRALFDCRVAEVALKGQVGADPGQHATLDVDDVKALLQEIRGRSFRSATRATHTDELRATG